MSGPAGVAALALLWAVTIYRTWRLPKGQRTPQRMANWLAIAALTLAATMFHPVVYRTFDEAIGVPNLAELVGHSLILIAAWQAHAVLIFLIYGTTAARRRVWAHGGLVAVTVTTMAVFFGLAPVDQEAPQTFTTVYSQAPYVVQYWVTFLVAANYLLVDLVRLVARYAARSPDEHLRLGLQLVAVGGSFGVGYWSYWITYLVLRHAGQPVPGGLQLVGQICMMGGIVFSAIGSTIPALGPRIGLPTPYAWWANLRAYRQLYPLWNALATAAPEIVLNKPPRLAFDIRFWLNRRIIEIEDGLRLYGRNTSGDAQPGPPLPPDAGGRHAAVMEARLIREALDAGRPPVEPPSSPPATADEGIQEASPSYTDRLHWHLDVARAYKNLGRHERRKVSAPVA